MAISWKVPAALVFKKPSKRSVRGELMVPIAADTTIVCPAATADMTAQPSFWPEIWLMALTIWKWRAVPATANAGAEQPKAKPPLVPHSKMT